MEIKDKKVVITGGAGFIGTSIAKKLFRHNRVIIFDNLHRNALQKTELLKSPNVSFIKGDVQDIKVLINAVKGANIIIHLAAIAGVDTVLESPVRTMKVNLIGTFNVLEAVLKTKDTVEKIVDFSTSEVFGTHAYRVEELHVTPTLTVGEARWTYAISKLAGEFLAHSYYIEFGLPAVTIRPFNIYGPNQVGVGAIHHFIVRALNGDDLLINGDGSQIRAWCYIDDIVDAVLVTLEKPEATGQVFNIGNPRSTLTVYDLAQRIINLSNSKSKIRFQPLNYIDVEIRIPNIEKAKTILKFNPKVELDKGLIKTIAWYRKQK
jgi:dTDP-glucose 4,6-dehydratase